MRNPGGYFTTFAEDSRTRTVTSNGITIYDAKEVDSFTCQHCNFVVLVPPMADPSNIGGLCKQCMGLVCPKCYDTGSCTPLEKRIEEIEHKNRLYRQMQEWG